MNALPSRKSSRPHRVVMFGYPDAQILDITGPLEVFARTARWLLHKGLVREPAYCVELVAMEAGPLRTSSGLSLIAERACDEVADADTLLVAGGIGCHRVMRDQHALDWIRVMSGKVSRLGSVCTGSLLLARAGLLDGRSATSHWDYVDELGEIGRSIRIDKDAIFVRDGNVYTSAGVTAGMDMALAMVEEDWGQPTALAVAQELVMFLKRPGGQSQFSSHLAAQFSEDDRLRELQLWILDHLGEDLSVPRLAARTAMSERNFSRRFRAGAGLPPARYVMRMRLQAARRKLEENDQPISQIARHCGLGSSETLRRMFFSELGLSPSDYRERFRSTTR